MKTIFFYIFFLYLICSYSCKRNLHESRLHKMKLYGNTKLGYYFINIFVGSNFQREALIIDTGSWVTAFPCTSTNKITEK